MPREHALPTLLLDFEVIGPLARTVADARLLFSVMRGPAAVDRSSLAAAYAAHGSRAKSLRVLYVERFGAAPLDPQVAASVGRAVRVFETMGHRVETGALPLDLDFYTQAWPQIGQAGLARLFEQHPAWAAQASKRYLDLAEAGRSITASRLWQIVEEVRQLRRDVAALFTRYDLIVTPAAAALPWPAQLPYPARIDGHDVGPRGHAVYTGWVNAAGLPALSLPCDPSAEGLPIGMQAVGAYGSDDALLEFGSEYERHSPWSQRWPDL